MIVLSNPVATGDAVIPYGLAIRSAYPNGVFGDLAAASNGTTRVPVQVLDAATQAALATDYRFPQISQGVPVQFADYQAGLRACHDLRLAAITVPVTIGGTVYQVPATKVYQDYLAACLAETLVSGGTTVTVVFRGGTHAIPLATFKTAYAAYRAGLRAVAAATGTGTVDHVTLRGQIESAQSASDLDAVTIN